jgi:hypothetical protein
MNYYDEDEEYEYNDENSYTDETEIDDELVEQEEPEEKNEILKALVAKKKNMYFDEELVKDLIINKYQPYLEYGVNEKGKRVCINRDNAPKDVEKEIMGNLFLIAKAIINKYRFWRFDTIDELQAEALRAMWVYLPNFIPNKGSAFDLFSIICKRHLLNFTLKNYKHRLTADVDVCYDLSAKEEINYNVFFEDLERTFLNIINRHYLKEKRKRYIELTSILMEYLVKNRKIVGKSDLSSAFKSYGYKSAEYKAFIEEMSKYKEEFYNLAR